MDFWAGISYIRKDGGAQGRPPAAMEAPPEPRKAKHQMTNIETAMAEIVQADVAARAAQPQRQRRVTARHEGWITVAIAGAVIAGAIGGGWFAMIEGGAKLAASKMGSDKETVQHMATIKVFKEFCPLSTPIKLDRVLANYESYNAEAFADQARAISTDLAKNPLLAGIASAVGCKSLQAMINIQTANW